MSEHAHKIGPYRYSAPGDLQQKHFTNDDGGTRRFSIVVASAYDAGIVGSEYNGVAVLDDDNRQVVFDRGGKAYDVAAQRQLAQQLMNADWPGFTELVKAQSGFRSGAVPDISAPQPDWVYPMKAEDNWKVMDVQSEGPDEAPYTYPAQTRREIIDELLQHKMHCERYGSHRLAWCIKVHGDVDTTGRSNTDYELEERFDERWAAVLAEDEQGPFNITQEAQENALRQFVDGEYTVYPGVNQGDYSFEVEGRSGGWLVLSEVVGIGKLAWSSQGDMEESLLELDAEQLAKLYKVVRNLDRDVTPEAVVKEMSYQYGYLRSSREEEWAADEPAPARP